MIRKALTMMVTAAVAAVAVVTAPPADARSYWAVAIVNHADTVSGYTKTQSLYQRVNSVSATLTDVGNEFHVAENCHGSLTIVRHRDGAVIARTVLATWPRGGTYHRTRTASYPVNAADAQIRISVWASLHYASDEGHYLPMKDACRWAVSAK